MKYFRVAIIGLLFAVFAIALRPTDSHAYGSATAITVATSAGGTQVLQPGIANHKECVTNTGASNTMYCLFGQTGGTTPVPTTTNYNFSLAPGTTWCDSSAKWEPTIEGESLLSAEPLYCIASGGTTTATWIKR